MLKIKSSAVAAATALAMAVSMVAFAPIASAATLTAAQVQSIVALVASFGADSATVASVTAALNGTSTTTVIVFKIGSSGAAVMALQKELIAGGYDIPAITKSHVAYGYYGAQTAAAVAARDAAKPAAVVPTSTVAGCAAGALFSGTTGQSCTATTTAVTPTSITTVGAEGSFSLTQAAQPANNTNVTSNSNTQVYGVQVKATGSDILVNSAGLEFAVKVNGSEINPSGFITSVSAWNGSTLLKTMPLVSSDFTKGSTNLYTVRVTGINFLVLKDTTKTLSFSINTNSVSSADYNRVVTVKGDSTNSIRGVDGAGLSSYASTGWTSSFTFQASNNSTLTATNNSSTPKAQNVVVGTDGVRGVTMQTVDLKSTLGVSTLTALKVTVNSGATSTPTALYLYNGDTLLSSAAVGTGTVVFSNLSLDIAKDTITTLTLKADFPANASGVASTSVSVTGSQYDTADGTTHDVVISSVISGNDVHLSTSASEWTLVSSSITPTSGVVGVNKSYLSGTIVLNVKANGASLTKPAAGDFTVFFASSTQLTTNGGAGYTAANGISVAPSVTVSPSDMTVGDGGSYVVTINGVLYSDNAAFGSSQAMFMVVNSIGSQNWGIDTFYTPIAQLTKGI